MSKKVRRVRLSAWCQRRGRTGHVFTATLYGAAWCRKRRFGKRQSGRLEEAQWVKLTARSDCAPSGGYPPWVPAIFCFTGGIGTVSWSLGTMVAGRNYAAGRFSLTELEARDLS